VRSFASAEEFAGFSMPDGVSCILLDLEMPGLSGLEFLEKHFQEKSAGGGCPVIIVTAHGSVPAAVKSFKLGAVDFLEKPFERPVLVKAVNTALASDRTRREAKGASDEVRKRLGTLSPREAELLAAVIEGKSTKMIADELGISARTVDHHRANLMAKMRAANVADLVRMSVEAGFAAKPGGPNGGAAGATSPG
jgi:FixJ family two-component response regulator